MSDVDTEISKPGSLKQTRNKVSKTRRQHSAPNSKSPRNLWLTAVKSGKLGKRNGTISAVKGSSADSWGFLSTSNYVRSLMPGKHDKHFSKSQGNLTDRSGSRNNHISYKSPEEYYDEVIELKKSIQSSNQEISFLKSKLRRIEEDNLKKEKEIEQLLDPKKSADLRRTLTDKNADSAVVIDSLKQKVLKLEIQLRNKEETNAKILSDIKTTKIEELKTEVECLYSEISRLRQRADDSGSRAHGGEKNLLKENSSKIKALNETVLRLNEAKKNLQQENMKLNIALKKFSDDGTELKINDKMVLTGSLDEKLALLDDRETELLGEIDRCHLTIKKLKDDQKFYKNTIDQKDTEMKTLKKLVDKKPLKHERSQGQFEKGLLSQPEARARKFSARPTSASSLESDKSPLSAYQRHQTADNLTKSRAAKSIQKQWRQHREEKIQDDVTANLQAIFKGHKTRTEILHKWEKDGSQL